jgi:hypothetical protein
MYYISELAYGHGPGVIRSENGSIWLAFAFMKSYLHAAVMDVVLERTHDQK